MKSVLVFGRGQYYKKKIEYLKDEYTIEAFVDNDIDRTMGDGYDGIPVIHPGEIYSFSQSPILIMVSWKSINEVVKQLIDLGINCQRLILGMNESPAVNETEEWLHKHNARLEVEKDAGITIRSVFGVNTFHSSSELKNILLHLYDRSDEYISILGKMSVHNFIKSFGSNRGTPIDRYYIEDFLDKNREYIHGNVAEMGELTYTKQFGHDLTNMYMLHVNQKGENILNVDLQTGEGIIEDSLDCFICTQTIQFIYDLDSVVHNIYRMLKKGGSALITAAGISKISMGDYNSWGEYWHFTKQSMRKIMETGGFSRVETGSFGNIKTAICFLYGMTIEDLKKEDFSYNDEQFQVIVTALVQK